MVVRSEKKVLLVQIKKWKKAQKVYKYVQSLIWCSWRRVSHCFSLIVVGREGIGFPLGGRCQQKLLSIYWNYWPLSTPALQDWCSNLLNYSPLGMSYKLWKMCSFFIFWVRWKCWVTHSEDQITRVMECAERLIPSDVWLLPPDLSAERLFSWAPPASRVCVWLQQAHSLHR